MPEPTVQPVFYLIPGLGADERIFRRLRLRGRVHVVEWLQPASPDEPLTAYAERMASHIPLDERCWLVGVSFGGIIALEMARLRPLALVALVSSIPAAEQLPPLLRLVRALGLQHWLPPRVLKLMPRFGQWYFGVNDGEEYSLFRQILLSQEPYYTRWAVRSLLQWDSRGIGPSVQLLGTRDRVFPPGPNRVQYLIEGGTHFMIYSHAEQISEILNTLAADTASEPPIVTT